VLAVGLVLYLYMSFCKVCRNVLAAHLLLYVVYYLYVAVTPGGSIPAGGTERLLVVYGC
jgi:hypothetical protein